MLNPMVLWSSISPSMVINCSDSLCKELVLIMMNGYEGKEMWWIDFGILAHWSSRRSIIWDQTPLSDTQ